MSDGEAPVLNLPRLNAKDVFDMAVVTTVSEDEPCFFLGEFNFYPEGDPVRHRYQLVKVVRNDRLATAYIDLGPASRFKQDEFTVFGGEVDVRTGKGRIWSTLGELRQIADENRAQPVRREVEVPDLQGAYNRLSEEKGLLKAHQSSYGYGGELMRPS